MKKKQYQKTRPVSFDLCHLMTNVINEPTRVSTNSYKGVLKTRKTLLDVCFTNDSDMICRSGVVDCPFSDHKFIFALLYLNARHGTTSNITARKFNIDRLNAVKIDILKAPFSVLDTFDSMEDKWYDLKKLIMNIVNEHAPIVSQKFRLLTIPSLVT